MTGFSWIFSGFQRVLPSFTEFYQVLPGFTAGGGYQRHLERRRYSRNDFSQSLLAFFCLALFFVPVSFHCPVGEPPKKGNISTNLGPNGPVLGRNGKRQRRAP